MKVRAWHTKFTQTAYSNIALSDLDRRDIAEDYKNEDGPSDGDIFYKIRQYVKSGDERGEKRWWARLSRTKTKDLKQLLRDTRFAQVFDELLPWPGMWSPVMLGSLHRMLTMKCEEVRCLRALLCAYAKE